MIARSLLGVLTLALIGCENDLPTTSFIDKLRVLAVKAEPPEVAPSATARLSTLTVEPDQPTVTLSAPSALWLACREQPGANTTLPCGLRPGELDGSKLPPACAAELDGDLCVLGTDLTASATPGPGLLGADGTGNLLLTVVVADTDSGATACYLDTVKNAGRPTEPDRCVISIKRLRIADPQRPATAQAPIDPPNQNPALTDLQLIDEDGTVRSLLSGDAVVPPSPDNDPVSRTLRAQRSDASAELLATGSYEALSLSWFTTGGQMDGGRSSFDPPGCESQTECATTPPPATTETKWKSPIAAKAATQLGSDGKMHFWAVLRDDRGGVGWLDGTLSVH